MNLKLSCAKRGRRIPGIFVEAKIHGKKYVLFYAERHGGEVVPIDLRTGEFVIGHQDDLRVLDGVELTLFSNKGLTGKLYTRGRGVYMRCQLSLADFQYISLKTGRPTHNSHDLIEFHGCVESIVSLGRAEAWTR